MWLSTKRNWFEGDPPDDRFHQSQKNEKMMEHLLTAFVTDSTRFLDPTCGSGVAIKIARRLGAHSALGLEFDRDSAVLAQAALRSEPESKMVRTRWTGPRPPKRSKWWSGS